MTPLPPWIELIAKESSASKADYTPKLIEAIGILWEGLDEATRPRGRFSMDQLEHATNVIADMANEAKDTMRRVEELK